MLIVQRQSRTKKGKIPGWKNTLCSIRINKETRKSTSWTVAEPKYCFPKGQVLRTPNNIGNEVWLKHDPLFYIVEVLHAKKIYYNLFLKWDLNQNGLLHKFTSAWWCHTVPIANRCLAPEIWETTSQTPLCLSFVCSFWDLHSSWGHGQTASASMCLVKWNHHLPKSKCGKHASGTRPFRFPPT